MSYTVRLGLSGVPDEYRSEGFGMKKIYEFIRSWPHKFLDRVKEADARFYIHTNSQEEFHELFILPLSGIVTDYLEQLVNRVNYQPRSSAFASCSSASIASYGCAPTIPLPAAT